MTEKDTNATATPKKGKSTTKAKKPKTAPSHPKVSDMVNAAITTLKERGGSSLAAIKKYIASNYKVDADKLAPFIRKYLKSAVASGALVQTKGKGANGSFRLGGGSTGSVKSASKPKKASTKAKATSTPKKAAKPKKAPQKSKPKKATPAKKAKPAAKTAAKKAKPVKIAKKKPAKASPKKKASAKKAKK